MKSLKYIFNYIDTCNMCGSNSSNHKVLGKRLNRSQGYSPQNKIGITTSVVKCRTCNLIFSNPLPVPISISDHYSVSPENYWKEGYFTLDESYFLSELKTLEKLITINHNSKALDIGAGIGKCMKAISNAGIVGYGLEASEPFYLYAVEKMGIDPALLKLSTIENAEYPDNNFDFITFGAVLEHLYNPSESIEKAMNWLKPGGVMHIEVPSSKWLVNKLVNFMYALRGLDYVANISPMHTPYHLYEFNLKSFEMNGIKNNYSVAQYEYFVCETYLPKVLDFIVKPFMRWTNTGMQLVVWLKKNK